MSTQQQHSQSAQAKQHPPRAEPTPMQLTQSKRQQPPRAETTPSKQQQQQERAAGGKQAPPAKASSGAPIDYKAVVAEVQRVAAQLPTWKGQRDPSGMPIVVKDDMFAVAVASRIGENVNNYLYTAGAQKAFEQAQLQKHERALPTFVRFVELMRGETSFELEWVPLVFAGAFFPAEDDASKKENIELDREVAFFNNAVPIIREAAASRDPAVKAKALDELASLDRFLSKADDEEEDDADGAPIQNAPTKGADASRGAASTASSKRPDSAPPARARPA